MATSGGSRRVARLKARSQAKSDAHATIARKALGDSRVSTDEQAEHGHSLENQERAGRAFAESQGDEVVDVIADAGASGTRRPAGRPRRGPLAPRSDAGRARPRLSPRHTPRKGTSFRQPKNPRNPSL